MSPGIARAVVGPSVAETPREPGCIELRLRELNQLFDSFDPAPFHEKDLDGDAEEFITSWAREFAPDRPLLFRLHLAQDQQRLQPERTVQEAVQHYFKYRAELTRLEIRRTLQEGRHSLVVGLVFLACCFGLRHLLHGLALGGIGPFVEEGLMIVGWVAMWRPLELLLYDWWPPLRRRRIFQNLSRMRVEVLYYEPRAVAPA